MDDHTDSEAQGSAGARGPEQQFPVVRAVLVLIVFVVTTIAVLGVIHPSTAAVAPGTSATTSTTQPAGHPATTTTTTTRPPSSVPVLVANASGVTGAAATITSQLQVGGWNMQPPVNATARVTTSHVYYVAGQQASAEAIATSLHLPPSAVAPYTTAAPISTIGTAEVVVVVGPDLASGGGSTSTTAN